MVKIYLPAKF